MEHFTSDSVVFFSPEPAKPNRRKSQSLEDILLEFEPISNVSYKRFETKPRRVATALLPATFPTINPYPYDYFALFFTSDLFCIITTNTNRYADTKS
jgi:hypothetical protein